MGGVWAVGGALVACHSGERFSLLDPVVAEAEPLCNAPLSSAGPVASLGVGMDFVCALLREGDVQCWGSNEHGSLGQNVAPGTLPADVPPLNFDTPRKVTSLSVGGYHACVVFDDGKARCWGRNDRGQLGLGDTQDRGDARQAPDLPFSTVLSVSAGASQTCAVVGARPGDLAGAVHCWGGDAARTPGGSGGVAAFGPPVPLPADARLVAAGAEVSCAALDARVFCWGGNGYGTLGIGSIACSIGDGSFCAATGGPLDYLPVQGLSGLPVRQLALNASRACVVDVLGELRCWGRNSESRAGYPRGTHAELLGVSPGPVELGVSGIQCVGLGTRHSCALDLDGQVRCWGAAGPQLGYGLGAQRGGEGIGGDLTPEQAYALRQDGGIVQLGTTEPVLGLFSGGDVNCVTLQGGDVRCWGSSAHGQLGYPEWVGDVGGDSSPGDAYAAANVDSVAVVSAD